MGEHGVASAAVDARGLVIAWSAGARRVLGYEHGEVVGRRAADLLADALPASARSRLAEPAEWRGPVHARHRDGHGVELELEAHPLLGSAGESQWFLTATVPEPAARLRRWALDQLPVPIALFDQAGLAVSANSAMEGVMGRQQKDLLGRRVGESVDGQRRIPGFEGLDEAVQHVLRTGEPTPYEAWLRAPGEAREHAWLVSLTPLKDGAARYGACAWPRSTAPSSPGPGGGWRAQRRQRPHRQHPGRDPHRRGTGRGGRDRVRRLRHRRPAGLRRWRGRAARRPPGAAPVVFRRAAQRSVLEGCPEAVVPVGSGTTSTRRARRRPARWPPAGAPAARGRRRHRGCRGSRRHRPRAREHRRSTASTR